MHTYKKIIFLAIPAIILNIITIYAQNYTSQYMFDRPKPSYYKQVVDKETFDCQNKDLHIIPPSLNVNWGNDTIWEIEYGGGGDGASQFVSYYYSKYDSLYIDSDNNLHKSMLPIHYEDIPAFGYNLHPYLRSLILRWDLHDFFNIYGYIYRGGSDFDRFFITRIITKGNSITKESIHFMDSRFSDMFYNLDFEKLSDKEITDTCARYYFNAKKEFYKSKVRNYITP